uniref:Uncharacterized protein n=1 Tax=Anguilla anguilla TaxID=7936 RepID=A0A0E9UQ48_ANGAN
MGLRPGFCAGQSSTSTQISTKPFLCGPHRVPGALSC